MGVAEQTTVPVEIRRARRALEGVEKLSILDDWKWFDAANKWALHLAIKGAFRPESRIPASTEWYVLVEAVYPLGSVKLFPSKKNCFTQTYPHQLYNGPGSSNLPWRAGELCLNTQFRRHDRYEDEPFGVDERLLWHCLRAIEWLDDAAQDQLAKDGDPFELPHFPERTKGLLVAYSESAVSLERWRANEELVGVVEPVSIPADVLVVKRFLSLRGHELMNFKWGRYIEHHNQSQSVRRGIWFRSPSVPVLSPWQAPATWGELREACKTLGVTLDALLRAGVARVRDGNPHLALIGFPIPERRGEANSNMHWQSFLLPIAARGRGARIPRS